MNINDVLNLIEVVAHGIHFFQGRILALSFLGHRLTLFTRGGADLLQPRANAYTLKNQWVEIPIIFVYS